MLNKKKLASILAAALMIALQPHAFAAPINDTVEGDFSDAPAAEPPIDDDLAKEELGGEEAPPPAEFPYPGAVDKNLQAAPETKLPGPSFALQRPKKIDDETGDYFYETKDQQNTYSGRTDVVAPQSVNAEGHFLYDKKTPGPAYRGETGREAPVEMRDTGEYYYKTEQSPESGSFSFRFGSMPAPDLKNAQTGTKFSDIYDAKSSMVLLVDYEKLLTGKAGRIGLKIGSGIYTASGTGQFKNTTSSRRSDDVPTERYTFLMFPNSVTGIYRFQYSDGQIFVPYVEGGLGYFGFTELRDDNITPKIGGAAVSIAAAGFNFNLDWLDRRAIRALDNEYGVNHVWLTTEFRVLVGLNKTYDFTSNVFNAGVMLEF